jgi:hypothetical protein
VTEDRGAGADLDAELDALFRAPLDEFTARRDQLAKRLRAAGAAPESQRVKALRKPTAVAWAINRLHLERRGLAEIESASGALRKALRDPRSAEERRDAIEARRRALERATTATVAILEEAGSAMSPALLRRVERTLLALATGASAGAEEVQVAGRLSQELEPPGFEAVLDAEPAAPLVFTPRATPAAAAKPGSAQPPARSKTTSGVPAESAPLPKQSSSASVQARTPAAEQPARRTAKPPAAAQPKPTASLHALPGRPAPRDSKEARAAQAALDRAEGELERATEKVEAARMKVGDAEKALAAARQQVDAARRELAAVRSRRDEARRELDRVRKL